ncbi:MAG: hypothetical protein JNN22_07030 [Rhodospirillales bacterium]|nr:hypothetical protein [Rhodospirillales bacterium]
MEFCADDVLAYAGARHRFVAGAPFALGEDYRLAHLPLVRPGHRMAIRSVHGRDYVDGRYATPRAALVAHVPAEALEASAEFQAAEAALRAAPFAAKIAWEICERRRQALHASIARPSSEAAAVRLRATAAALTTAHGAPALRLGGPFVGSRNHGRIYLPAYPQRIEGGNPYDALQRAAGQDVWPFYAVGIWHLAEALDAHEAAALADLCAGWFGRETARIPFARLAILTVTDDLALGGANWDWIDSYDYP